MSTHRILLVDDDAHLRKTLCDILRLKGYDPLPAATGKAALECVATEPPAVALIDLRLEDMSGLDVMEQLKRRLPDTECILLTGHASQDSAIQAITLGAYDYVQKPYDIEQLLMTIRRAIEKHEAVEALRRSEANYRTIFNAVSDAIFVYDYTTGDILDANQKACDLYGYTPEEVRGLSIEALSAGMSADSQKTAAQWITKVFEHGPQLFEWQTKAKDGRLFWVEINLERATIEDQDRILAVVRDITRRKQMEEAQRASESANRAKSEFMANMSHELRTPLNAILGFAQILSASDNLTDRQKQGLETIEHSGMHLLKLINEILDLARIEAGRLELERDDICFPEFLTGIVGMMRVNAEQKGLVLRYECAAALPMGVRADEQRLQEVLLNMIGNAIKFTEQGSVTFRATVCRESQPLRSEVAADEERRPKDSVSGDIGIRFEVEDTGPGIAVEQLEAIFQPFQQVGEHAGSIEGTGLGLAISRKLVDMMGGQLQVRSIVGTGSTFWFELDLPTVAGISVRTARHFRKLRGYTGARRSILVADDNENNRAVLVGMLLPLGFTIVEAENGQECLEKALNQKPDLMLLDLRMPVLDGFSATQQIRATDALRNVVIIAVSASVFEQTRQRALAIGFNDFLFKPIQKHALLHLLETHLHMEWVYEDDAEERPDAVLQAGSAAHAAVSLPSEDIARLLAFAERGNVKSIREQLDRIERLGEQFLPLVAELRALAARFQVDELIEKLDAMRENPHNDEA